MSGQDGWWCSREASADFRARPSSASKRPSSQSSSQQACAMPALTPRTRTGQPMKRPPHILRESDMELLPEDLRGQLRSPDFVAGLSPAPALPPSLDEDDVDAPLRPRSRGGRASACGTYGRQVSGRNMGTPLPPRPFSVQQVREKTALEEDLGPRQDDKAPTGTTACMGGKMSRPDTCYLTHVYMKQELTYLSRRVDEVARYFLVLEQLIGTGAMGPIFAKSIQDLEKQLVAADELDDEEEVQSFIDAAVRLGVHPKRYTALSERKDWINRGKAKEALRKGMREDCVAAMQDPLELQQLIDDGVRAGIPAVELQPARLRLKELEQHRIDNLMLAAAAAGDYAATEELIRRGANCHALRAEDRYSLWHLAVQSGNLEIAHLAQQLHVTVSDVDICGYTPLLAAIAREVSLRSAESSGFLEFLIEAGSDLVYRTPEAVHALSAEDLESVSSGLTSMVDEQGRILLPLDVGDHCLHVGDQLLCREGAEAWPPTLAKRTANRTPLHVAVLRAGIDGAEVRVLELLLGAGCEVDVWDDLGRTPMWYAAYAGSVGASLTLLAAGASAPILSAKESALLASIRRHGIATMAGDDGRCNVQGEVCRMLIRNGFGFDKGCPAILQHPRPQALFEALRGALDRDEALALAKGGAPASATGTPCGAGRPMPAPRRMSVLDLTRRYANRLLMQRPSDNRVLATPHDAAAFATAAWPAFQSLTLHLALATGARLAAGPLPSVLGVQRLARAAGLLDGEDPDWHLVMGAASCTLYFHNYASIYVASSVIENECKHNIRSWHDDLSWSPEMAHRQSPEMAHRNSAEMAHRYASNSSGLDDGSSEFYSELESIDEPRLPAPEAKYNLLQRNLRRASERGTAKMARSAALLQDFGIGRGVDGEALRRREMRVLLEVDGVICRLRLATPRLREAEEACLAEGSWLRKELLEGLEVGSSSMVEETLMYAQEHLDPLRLSSIINMRLRDGLPCAVCYAAMRGDADCLKPMLVAKGSPNSLDVASGKSALALAVEAGSMPCFIALLHAGGEPSSVEALLEQNMDEDDMDQGARQFKHEASTILQQTVTQRDIDTHALAAQVASFTPGCFENIRRLLAFNADANAMTLGPTGEKISVLSRAVMHRHAPLVRVLLQHRALVRKAGLGELSALRLAEGTSMLRTLQRRAADELMFAVSMNDVPTIQVLLDAGVDVETPLIRSEATGAGTMLLTYALELPEHIGVPFMKDLLNRKANTEIVDGTGSTPLVAAVRHCAGSAFVEVLIKAGGNVAITDAEDGATLASIAAANGQADTLRLLLDAGAPAHLKDKLGLDSAMTAFMCRQFETMDILTEYGHTVDYKATLEELFATIRSGPADRSVALLKAAERIFPGIASASEDGRKHLARVKTSTLLMAAVEARSVEVLVTLLEHGAPMHPRWQSWSSSSQQQSMGRVPTVTFADLDEEHYSKESFAEDTSGASGSKAESSMARQSSGESGGNELKTDAGEDGAGKSALSSKDELQNTSAWSLAAAAEPCDERRAALQQALREVFAEEMLQLARAGNFEALENLRAEERNGLRPTVEEMSLTDESGNCALDYCLKHGRGELEAWLVERGARFVGSADWPPALAEPSKVADVMTVRRRLGAGCKVGGQDKDSRTALDWCVIAGSISGFVWACVEGAMEEVHARMRAEGDATPRRPPQHMRSSASLHSLDGRSSRASNQLQSRTSLSRYLTGGSDDGQSDYSDIRSPSRLGDDDADPDASPDSSLSMRSRRPSMTRLPDGRLVSVENLDSDDLDMDDASVHHRRREVGSVSSAADQVRRAKRRQKARADPRHAHASVEEVLIEAGERLGPCVRGSMICIREPLEARNFKAVRRRIDAGADCTNAAICPDRGLSLAHVALDLFGGPVVSDLVRAGSEPDNRDHRGRTVLWRAVELQDMDLIEVCLENEADMTLGLKETNDSSLVHLALETGQPQVATKLLKRDRLVAQQLLAKLDRNRKPPLWRAMEGKFTDVVRCALDQGAEVRFVCEASGQGYIHLAMQQGQRDLIRELLRRGASATLVDHSGITPLMQAMKNEDLWLVDVFVEASAGPSDPYGEEVRLALQGGQFVLAERFVKMCKAALPPISSAAGAGGSSAAPSSRQAARKGKNLARRMSQCVADTSEKSMELDTENSVLVMAAKKGATTLFRTLLECMLKAAGVSEGDCPMLSKPLTKWAFAVQSALIRRSAALETMPHLLKDEGPRVLAMTFADMGLEQSVVKFVDGMKLVDQPSNNSTLQTPRSRRSSAPAPTSRSRSNLDEPETPTDGSRIGASTPHLPSDMDFLSIGSGSPRAPFLAADAAKPPGRRHASNPAGSPRGAASPQGAPSPQGVLSPRGAASPPAPPSPGAASMSTAAPATLAAAATSGAAANEDAEKQDGA
eukprot:TRINITY_DN7194_c0_g1_i11.p1 TRINITY_DN7194_c0_g1~~TRINITY_DN7194_c0_g1_i11.p1  ORF type:complete len:2399 (-),score=590.64 TRINITY_DN7194_c0_g1_i11:320-7516(-)